ncbi:hypothetical protein MUK42_28162 [Musa troglodytarum]|uniref:Uncharacterized protein n=1 Tax=Musa troglodytarum TaxID=320322 RepID=A0A9E7FA84_9LILI|nr:hypothetical protein MUK42_28162 [Musa troglodytarum]
MSAELRRWLFAQEKPDGLPTVLRYLYSAFPLTSVSSIFPSRSPGSRRATLFTVFPDMIFSGYFPVHGFLLL